MVYDGENTESPPLVRERLHFLLQVDDEIRITPARAGKTHWVDGSSCGSRNHPRSCGKDTVSFEALAASSESPPLVRERRPQNFRPFFRPGITPARAGKTSGKST